MATSRKPYKFLIVEDDTICAKKIAGKLKEKYKSSFITTVSDKKSAETYFLNNLDISLVVIDLGINPYPTLHEQNVILGLQLIPVFRDRNNTMPIVVYSSSDSPAIQIFLEKHKVAFVKKTELKGSIITLMGAIEVALQTTS